MTSSPLPIAMNVQEERAIVMGLRSLLQFLHRSKNDEFISLIFFGGIGGLLCAIPAIVVGSRKGQEFGNLIFINIVAGALAGLCLAIPTGIGTLIYAMNQPSKK